MKKVMIPRSVVFCLLISTLFSVAYADDLIYSNSTSSGYTFALGYDNEVYDYGTSIGGRISKFTFRYASSSTLNYVVVRFYSSVDTRVYDTGYCVQSLVINNVPSTGGYLQSYTYEIPEQDRFELPSGTFGYSFQWPSSSAAIGLASGGTGNENVLWENLSTYYSGSFWFGGYPWAGFYMKVYKAPPIEETTCDIKGYKFDDQNANGVLDAGEPYLSGWMVYIDENGNDQFDASEPNSVTDPNGMYLFDNIDSPATYTVREVMQEGWSQTFPGGTEEHVLVTEPNNVYFQDFGNTQQQSNAAITGKTFLDNNANELYDAGDALDSSWKVYVDENENGKYDEGEKFTFSSYGNYTLTGLSVGTHIVSSTIKPGYVRTFPAREMTHTVTIETAGQLVTDIDFGHHDFAGYGGGSGTVADPYLLSSKYHLQALGANKADWSKHFKMTANIILTKYKGEEFNMIGRYNYYDQEIPFSGTFDGNGFYIGGFSYGYTGTRQEYIGLFGYVHGGSAEIKNLKMFTTNIDTKGDGIGSGAMIGWLRSGSVSNCFVGDGLVKNDESNVGGMIGYCSYAFVTDCHARIDVENTGGFGTGSRGGGLIGTNSGGVVTDCSAAGSVVAHVSVGGLIGSNGGTIRRCYADSDVTGFQEVGGLVGKSEGDGFISECYSTGTLQTVDDDYTGLDGNDAGGLVGRLISGADVENCYSSVDVAGDKSTGGLVGLCWTTDLADTCRIINSYSTGAVSGVSYGGLIGHNIDGVITGCVWDKETSGRTWSAAGAGMTTRQMQKEWTFANLGWDMSTPVWKSCPIGGYPVLAWQNDGFGPGGVTEKWSDIHGDILIDEGKKVLVDFEGNVVVASMSYVVHETEVNHDFIVCKYTPSGELLWKKTYDSDPAGDENDILGYMALDAAGNIYVTGVTGKSNRNVLTLKYSPAGTLLWDRVYDGPDNQHDEIKGIAVDGAGNVYLAGETYNTSSGRDYCLVKYNASGVFQWEKITDGGNNGSDYVNGVAVDSSGNVFLIGDPDDYNTVAKIQTFKYNSAGVLQWQKDYAATAETHVNSENLAVDSSGNIYVSGVLYKESDTDFLLLKYNTAGGLEWSRLFDIAGYDQAWSQMTLDDTGDIYLAGETYTLSSYSDYVIVRYSPDGTKLWHQTFNGPENERDSIAAISVGSDQNVYVTGISGYRRSMNRIVDGHCRTQKYNSNGDLVWSVDHDGPQGVMELPYSIAVADGQVYVTGGFEGKTMYGDSGVVCYADCSYSGDCNMDNKVDLADFAVLAGQWLETNCNECQKADWTGDGNVNAVDLTVMADNWLEGVNH